MFANSPDCMTHIEAWRGNSNEYHRSPTSNRLRRTLSKDVRCLRDPERRPPPARRHRLRSCGTAGGRRSDARCRTATDIHARNLPNEVRTTTIKNKLNEDKPPSLSVCRRRCRCHALRTGSHRSPNRGPRRDAEEISLHSLTQVTCENTDRHVLKERFSEFCAVLKHSGLSLSARVFS